MAATHDDTAMGSRRIDHWFASYSDDHRDALNQRIHVVAVPAILWSVIAMLWCIPAPFEGIWLKPGAIAGFAMVPAAAFYFRNSRVIGLGMLAIFIAMGALCWWIRDAFGVRTLLVAGISVFVVAWIAQFIGHKYEGRKPSFLTDLTYLLIGPAWVLAKGLRKLGIAW
jgi:uncharacterized membrane protein YGL010W